MRTVFFVFVFGFVLASANPFCQIDVSQRIDCHPEPSATKSACEKRGCCWQSPTEEKDSAPLCFYPSDFGYTVTSVSNTANGFTATLAKQGSPGPYGPDISPLQLEVVLESDTILHFKISDPNSRRWEVPLVVDSEAQRKRLEIPTKDSLFEVSLTKSPFGISVTRRSSGIVVFNTTLGGFVFEDQFLQISTKLPNDAQIYGIGEHVEPLRQSTNYSYQTGFARDQFTTVGGTNLYGSHPFYLQVEEDGNAHGVFLLNSNALDIILQPNAITYRTIGGVLDFYMFLGPEPETVIEQYTSVIGRPFFPPYWSLGFHLCRWGYNSLQATAQVVQKMETFQLPQDVQWNDIDYMDRYLDFTLDPKAFPPKEMSQFVDDLHRSGRRYIMMIDPGISNVQTPGSYPPYDEGLRLNVFINASNGKPFVGEVWPGSTVWPDFLHPKAEEYWHSQIKDFYSVMSFDGMWIDMNEPSNFRNDDCLSGPKEDIPMGFDPQKPPYMPRVAGGNLDEKTICMNAVQHPTLHYNAHSLYGYSETIVTNNVLKRILNKRTIVISRSTFPGSGHHGGHWLGDNASKWSDLYYSIPGILAMNLFGIPFVGADICGFEGNATRELCTRWTQLGAFYPFMRNHNSINMSPQEPYVFGDHTTNIMRAALLARYTILPYFYTLLYRSHVQGGTVARPLVFEFPRDEEARGIDQQFLLGRGLLISPVVTEGATTVKAYFPDDVWYNYTTGIKISGASWEELPAPIEVINVHIRGGSIVPQQEPSLTTTASRLNPFSLVVALGKDGTSRGELYLDDGESLDSVTARKFNLISYSASSSAKGAAGRLEAKIDKWGYVQPVPKLNRLKLYGVGSSSQSPKVIVNGKSISTFSYHKANQVLTIESLQLQMEKPFTVEWTV